MQVHETTELWMTKIYQENRMIKHDIHHECIPHKIIIYLQIGEEIALL